jgi:serine protease inhibitor
MNLHLWKVVLVGCLVLGLMGCVSSVAPSMDSSSQPTGRPTNQPTNQPNSSPTPTAMPVAIDAQVVNAQKDFGFKLFAKLLKKDADQNVMMSPSSVAIALSMVYNGANGDTQKAMAQALALQGVDLATLNQANQVLAKDLQQADPQVKLAIANSLWGAQGFEFKPDFLQRTQDFYRAEVRNLDFSSPSAVEQINGWVKQKTEGKISEMVREIEQSQVLFLINAVYFKGAWTRAFDPKQTRDRPFTLLNGGTQQTPMMSQKGRYAYLETEQFQAVSLPYGNKRFSMEVFLPKGDLAAFSQTLTVENWNAWMTKLATQQGSIQLPRFQFEYGTTLKAALAALGMEPAFGDRADFSGLSHEFSEGKAVISQVLHKTFIEVNETGTEAAAATSVGIVTTSAPIGSPFEMVVDRPFVMAIRDRQTGTILFLGTVVEP